MVALRRSLWILILVAVAATMTVFTPTANAQDTTLRVVSLGDSFTSGNGALDYFNKECYRSSNSYVYQYAEQVAGRRSVQPDNFACHGNVTSDIPTQINEAGGRLSQADLVFVTIGGNDGNFKDVVIDCLAATRFFQLCHDDINRARDDLDNTIANIRNSLLQIHEAAPNAEVVLIGYPYLISENCFADANIVRSLQAAADTHTFLMVHGLRESGESWVQYLSTITPFKGGEVCGDDGQLIRGALDTFKYEEWFHPNVEGHSKIAQELYALDLHTLESTTEPGPSTPEPVYTTTPPTNGQPVYADLPFECGEVAPFASTYGSFVYQNTTYYHGHALDFPMPEGTPVITPVSGTARVYLRTTGYGKYVDVHADDGVIHRFAHLAHPSVQDGARVVRGQRVGLVGSTGASTGPHLHYEQRNTSGQIPIDLGGPALRWNNPDSTGFLTTSHGLVGGNCGQSTRLAHADIMSLSGGHFYWDRSDGRVADERGTAKQNVFVPESVDSCDFDGDGWDEYIVLDVDTSRVMIADPKGSPNGHFYWRQIGTTTSARKIVCGDWNNDGLDDVLMHNNRNVIYYGRSNGSEITEWRVARLRAGGQPTFWDMCDINGDGKDDLVTYHAGSKRFLAGHRASGVAMHRVEIKANIADVGGFTCGKFHSGKNESVILWHPGLGGQLILSRWDSNYKITSWYRFDVTGRTGPFNGEMESGDVDGDGLDEVVVNIIRRNGGYHRVKVMDITGTKTYEWYTFLDNVPTSYLAVGEFVR